MAVTPEAKSQMKEIEMLSKANLLRMLIQRPLLQVNWSSAQVVKDNKVVPTDPKQSKSLKTVHMWLPSKYMCHLILVMPCYVIPMRSDSILALL